MSGTLFKQVELLAEQMLEAAEADDEPRFYQHYEALEALCMSHQGKKSDHPVLWETLADFSEDNPRAIALYQQAFSLADQLKKMSIKRRLCSHWRNAKAKRVTVKQRCCRWRRRSGSPLLLRTRSCSRRLLNCSQLWLNRR